MKLLERSRGLRWGLLALVLLFAAWIRIDVAARSVTLVPFRADALHYFSYAWNLRNHGVYSGSIAWSKGNEPVVPDAVVTPGYPLFLLAVPGFEADEAFVPRVALVQALLGVLLVWMCYLLAAMVMSAPASLLAAALTALSPHLVVFEIYMLTETLFSVLLMASVLVAAFAIRRHSNWYYAIAGATLGLCTLVRPTMQLLPFAFVLLAFLVPSLRPFRRASLAVLLGFVLLQAPWQLRKALLPANGPDMNLTVNFLQHGSYPGLMYENRPETYGFPYAYDPLLKQSTRSVGTVLAGIAHHFEKEPLRYARWYLLGKPGEFLAWTITNGYGEVFPYPPLRSPFLDDPNYRRMLALAWALHWPLMLAGLAGALLGALRPNLLGLDGDATAVVRVVAAVVIYAVAFHMIGAPFSRYSVPFRPFFYVLAMVVASAPWRRGPRMTGERPLPA